MTQADRLLQYLKKNRYIEPMTAWQELGIYRLAARVYELRKSGHTIQKNTKNVTNRFGEKCNIAEYQYLWSK